MLKRFLAFALVVGVGFAFLAGCDDTPEQNRSVVTVASLNCNAPGFADMRTDSNGVAETWVTVILENRPYNIIAATAPGRPYGDFIVTSYRIEWASVSGGPVLPPREETTSMSIPSGDTIIGSLRLVTLNEKIDPITAPALAGTFLMQANITLRGHESGTDRETEVEASIVVSFADFSPDPEQPSCD